MNNILNKNFWFENYKLIFLYLLIIISINIDIDYLNFQNTNFSNKFEITSNINVILLDIIVYSKITIAYAQFLIFPLLLYLNIKNFKKTNRCSIFIKTFIGYSIIQITSLILSDNSNYNIIYPTQMINLCLFLNFINQTKPKYLYEYLFLFLAILLIPFLLIHTLNMYLFLFENRFFYGHYPKNLDYLSVPRSSGLSRTALVYIVFFYFFYEYSKKIFFKNLNIIFFIPIIFLYQSRIILVIYLIFILLINLRELFALNNLKKIFKNISQYIIIPLIIYFIIINLNPINFHASINKIKDTLSVFNNERVEVNIKKNKNNLNNSPTYIRKKNDNDISSGRFNDWERIIKKTNRNFLIGYGSQADRYLIQQTSSNFLVYIYSSSGLLGIIITIPSIFIFIIYILKVLKNFFYNKYLNPKLLFCFFLLILFAIRSLVETSFAVFSIDFVIFIISCLIVENDIKKLNKQSI